MSVKEIFDIFLTIREKAYGQMELMRKEQVIGSSLETQVTVFASPKTLSFLKEFEDDLREFLIVSQVQVQSTEPTDYNQLQVEVTKARGEKCQRCWNYSVDLDKESLCPKCLQNL